MGFAILAECFHHGRIGLVAVSLQCIQDQPEPPIRHDGALQRRVGLKTDNDFILAIDVTGAVRGNGTGHLRNVEHPFAALFRKERFQLFPDLLCSLGGVSDE